QIKETCVRDQGSLSSAHWFISCNFLEDGSREMYSILHKFRESIEYVTETTHGRLKFQEAVDQLESEFDILASALKSREIFCQLEQIDGNFKLNPSMEEWEKAIALKSESKPALPLDGDVLGWWRVNSLRLPTLAKMARDHLAMLVS
ncbi:hypothetical protein Gohar_025564, partial [Gossypium harknessii]|nr:hypothetical protein [Gossypium harknessii]